MKHKKFETLKKYLAIQDINNFWIWGPAGSGKSQACYEIANELKQKIVPVQCSPTMTIEDLIGYINLNNQIIAGPIWYLKDNEILLLEECDLLNPKVQNALNTLLQERKFTIGSETKEFKNLRVIATANTNGLDSDENHQTRSGADLSLLSRFLIIKWEIDENIEKEMLTEMVNGKPELNTKWYKFIINTRKICQENGIQFLITPRQTKNIGILLKAGFSNNEIYEDMFENFNGAEMLQENEEYVNLMNKLFTKNSNNKSALNKEIEDFF